MHTGTFLGRKILAIALWRRLVRHVWTVGRAVPRGMSTQLNNVSAVKPSPSSPASSVKMGVGSWTSPMAWSQKTAPSGFMGQR